METKEQTEHPFLKLTITHIGFKMKQRTYDLILDASLGGIYMQHLQYKGNFIYIYIMYLLK